jgi:hypothetical protein
VTRLGAGPGASPSASPSPSGGSAGSTVRTIAAAILEGKGAVTIEGSVTIPASLLDATHRRIVVQDRTAAVEVLVASGAAIPPVGARVRVAGEIGRAYGAPRLKAAAIARLGTLALAPIELRTAPGAAHEWRLVKVRGDVVEVHRSGDRWTADLLVGGVRVAISGLAGSKIPSTALTTGRTASIVGIVRRPHPSATDRRFAVVPRSASDLVIGGAADGGSSGSTGSGGSGTDAGAGVAGLGAGASPSSAGAPNVDLADLARHGGATVRVGGLVRSVGAAGFELDDGTAVASVRLSGDAADVAGSIQIGDALSAVGRIDIDSASKRATVVVTDPAAVTLVGDLGGDDPSVGPSGDVAGSTAPGAATAGSAAPHALSAGLTTDVVPELGAVGFVLVSLASLAVTLLRRQRTRRRFAARIAERLSALGAPTSGLVPALATVRARPSQTRALPVDAGVAAAAPSETESARSSARRTVSDGPASVAADGSIGR